MYSARVLLHCNRIVVPRSVNKILWRIMLCPSSTSYGHIGSLSSSSVRPSATTMPRFPPFILHPMNEMWGPAPFAVTIDPMLAPVPAYVKLQFLNMRWSSVRVQLVYCAAPATYESISKSMFSNPSQFWIVHRCVVNASDVIDTPSSTLRKTTNLSLSTESEVFNLSTDG